MARDFEDMPLAPNRDRLLGHNRAFRASTKRDTLDKLALQGEPILRLAFPFGVLRSCVVAHPDVLQEVLVEKAKSFDKSDSFRFTAFPYMGEGVFLANDPLWTKQRRLMAPLFVPQAIERYAKDMVECAITTELHEDRTFPLWRETTRLAMRIAGKALFDADMASEEIERAVTSVMEWSGRSIGQTSKVLHVMTKRGLDALAKKTSSARFGNLARRFRGPVILGRDLGHAIDVLHTRVQRLVDERRAKPGSDLLSHLLAARDENGTPMSDEQVRDEVITLFVAGHETMATAIAWTIHEACKHPEIYAQMEREADAVGDRPAMRDLGALQVTLRVFKEALRLYPPFPAFSRDNREAIEIGGYRLPARTNVLLSPWILQRAPRDWPDPERFDPDRFLPDREASRHRYAYVPFGAGPRICIGNHFAYLEGQLVLAVLLRRWRFTLVEHDVPAWHAPTLRPDAGVLVRATRR